MREMYFLLPLASCLTTMFCSVSTYAAQRDWNSNPAVVQLDTNENIYVMSDAHGDPHRLLGILRAARVVDNTFNTSGAARWIAGKSVLVVAGDFINKGTESLKVISVLHALQRQARTSGGRVIVTMGNHEAEFLADPGGRKPKDFRDELETAGIQPKKVVKCEGEIGSFLCQLPIAARVNDWFISHAGNTNNRSIEELSEDIAKGFEEDGFGTQELLGANSVLEARLNKKGPGGLAWFYEGNKDTDVRAVLSQYVEKLGVKHLILGHQAGKVKFQGNLTRGKADLFQAYGLIFLVDTAMSRGISDGSIGGAIRISKQGSFTVVTAICADGDEKVLWDSYAKQDSSSLSCAKE